MQAPAKKAVSELQLADLRANLGAKLPAALQQTPLLFRVTSNMDAIWMYPLFPHGGPGHFMRGLFAALGMAITLAFAAPAVAQVSSDDIKPAFEYQTTGFTDFGEVEFAPFTIGFSFTLSQPKRVNALGYWAAGNLVTSREVGLWNSTGQLLRSTTVSTDDALEGHYYYSAVESLLLDVGEYVIGGRLEVGDFMPGDLMGITNAPDYAWLAHRELAGPELAFPTLSPGGFGSQSIAQVNLSLVSAVPEPATWMMMLIGFGGVGMVIRRRRKSLAPAAA